MNETVLLDEVRRLFHAATEALGPHYDSRRPLADCIRDVVSALVSVGIERDHWKATARALTGGDGGHKAERTMTECLDGIWLSELGLKLPSQQRAEAEYKYKTPRWQHDVGDCDFDGRYHYKKGIGIACACKCHQPRPEMRGTCTFCQRDRPVTELKRSDLLPDRLVCIDNQDCLAHHFPKPEEP